MLDDTKSLRADDHPSLAVEFLRICELVICLAWRDLRLRYKQSVLGVAWAVIQPFSLMLVFALVLGPVVRSSIPDNMPYALFAFAGLVPWTYFSSGLMLSVSSLVANRNLITKVYFPRESFPFSCVATSLVDFVIGLAALAGLMVYFHATGAWATAWHSSMFFLPALIFVQTLLMAGLGLLAAMGHLFYRDVRPMLGVALQLGMFVSAVVVPAPCGQSGLAQLVALNPLVPLISGYRECLLHGRIPDMAGFIYAAVFALFVFCAGWIAFRRASFRFAECI